MFAVVLCSVFDAEIQQIDILIIRRILSNECYLTAILYMGRMFRKYQRYMPVNIWSIGVLLMLLLFLQYKNDCGQFEERDAVSEVRSYTGIGGGDDSAVAG